MLVVIWAFARPEWPRGRALAGVIVFGALNFGLSYALIYVALVHVSAGTAQLMLAFVPLLTLGLAIIHGVERFRRNALLGALIAVAGMAVIFAEQVSLDVPLLSLTALFAGAVVVAEASVAVKWFPNVHPVTQNTIGMAVGVAVLAALSIFVGETWQLPQQASTWIALLYLSVVGSAVVFLLIIYVLHRWTATATSYTFLVLPLVTILLGTILLGEQATPAFVVGGAIVLVGVYVGAFLSRARDTSGSNIAR